MLLVAACVVPLAAFSAALLERNAEAEERQLEQRVRERVHLLAEDVDREINRIVAAAEVLATASSLETGDLETFYRRAVQIRDLIGTNILIRDLTSQQLVNTRVPWGEPLPKNPPFEVDRQAIETRSPQVSGLLMGAVAKRPLLIVVVPVPRQGDPKYLLSFMISLERLQALFTPDRLPPGWVAGIVDREGTIVARSAAPEQYVGTKLPVERWSAIKDAPQGLHKAKQLEGVESVQAYEKSHLSGWLVAISVPTSVIAGPMRQSVLLFAIGGLVIFLLSLAAALLVGRRLSWPIQQLARSAEALGAGHHAPAPERSIHEVNLVSLALDHASQLIDQRTSALTLARNEADRANLAKSKFLASASHDLRQPVQSLALFQSVLAQRLADHPAAKVVDHMEQAMSGLKMLLDSLLDISKLDAGMVTPQPEDMPLRPILERLKAEYEVQAEERGLSFRTMCSNAVVRSDPALLERILRNFIENALRYTLDGGILLGCKRNGNELLIEVADTGIGIPPEAQSEIFEEFYQVGNPERDRAKGLGLGLAVVKKLAKMLGHETFVHSQPGRGSVFCIQVPLISIERTQDVSEEEETVLVAPDRNGRGRLLVVDDDELVRMGLQAMLEGWGYEVVTAESLASAVNVIDQGVVPDAILADYRLRGGETGLEVIRAVHAKLSESIPATILTGDTAPERLTEASSAGFGLLHKPVGAADLKRTVLDMVD